ncbi:MAG: AAA family ATPase, partial [Candidatus Hodarchaeota archaeon]
TIYQITRKRTGETKMSIDLDSEIEDLQKKFGIVGRRKELRQLILARMAGKHAIIEGPVGVGKTTLAHAVAEYFDQDFVRIDGDERYTEAKLVGHFEPPIVIDKGWTWDAFVPGPLTMSMKKGSVLFINEANRLVEGTQNVLLPALDEGIIIIPKIGVVRAEKGFFVVATQNPESYIGTTVLSEALKDRFVWVRLDYQDEEEEFNIVAQRGADQFPEKPQNRRIFELAVRIARTTREHPDLNRGASIRGAIDLAQILLLTQSITLQNVTEVAIMTLATKIDLMDGVERSVEKVIEEIVKDCL